jgi:hypothetical protein
MTMKMTNRKSRMLSWLKSELRDEAIKCTDEELKSKLWRWYYRAQNAEYEVNELVLKAELRDVLELLLIHKVIDVERLRNLRIEFGIEELEIVEVPPEEKKPKTRKQSPPDNANLPKQLKLWDESP